MDSDNLLKNDSFQYRLTDFHHTNSISSNDSLKMNNSRFDELVCTIWKKKIKEGQFRHDLSGLKSRVLAGKYGFILQLNLERCSQRRTPAVMDKVDIAYDESKFNFTKTKDEERIFFISPYWGDVMSKHALLINVSPIEFGSSLIVPDIDKKISQKLTINGIRIALDFMLLSGNPGLRIGFNSACALASVNHQHLHTWYINHTLYIENIGLYSIGHDVFEIRESFLNAFVFLASQNNIDKTIRAVSILTQFLHTHDIAHNVCYTKGRSPGEIVDYNIIRICVIPREKFLGDKCENMKEEGFYIAAVELFGHIPCYDEEAFGWIDEEYIIKRIADVKLPQESYDSIKQTFLSLL